MKTAISALVIWLALAALADPVAAQADVPRRSAVGEVIEARKPQALRPVTKSMRPPNGDEQLALVVPKVKMPTAKSPEDESSPKPNDIVIDVIVAYTKKAASNYADIERELVDLAIEETNKSFRLSNLGHIKLRLVHAYQTDYVEEGAHFDHVWRFADKGDGYMEEIHGLRDKYRADVSILFWMTRRAAGWRPECVPTPTKHSPSCITSAPPRTTRWRTRSDTSSVQAMNSATSTAPSGAISWAPRKAAAAARACPCGRARPCFSKASAPGLLNSTMPE